MSIIDAVMGKNMAIEELTKSGGAGYTEPVKAFTCDGNPNGENVYDGDYRITSKVLDLTTVTSLTFVSGGQPVTMTKEEFIGMGGEVNSERIGGDGMGYLVRTVHTDGNEPVGTYVWCSEEGYVSRIEFAGAIHPIDPKYLPGGGVGYTEKPVITFDGNPDRLPIFFGNYCRIYDVVDLNTVTSITGVMDGQQIILTSDMFEVRSVSISETSYINKCKGIYMKDGFDFPTDVALVICFEEGDSGVLRGLYVLCTPKEEESYGYVSRIEFAEIAHPIDPKYLGDAMPKIVDLAEFETTFDNGRVDISTLILLLTAISVQSDGALQDVYVPDENLTLRKALTTNRHVLLRMHGDGAISTIPAVIMKNENTGMAAQVAASALFFMGGLVIDMKVIFLYNMNPDDTDMRILVQAKVIAA